MAASLSLFGVANSMMRDVYAQKALEQVPRLLSLEDRNPFSPTYGCCNREYWLCRSTDFPSSIAQFGIHALALAWKNPMPGNIYHQHDKIRDWVVAGMQYWMKIQKRDGSFDEFYPNERGWAGPTGFLLYAMIDSYNLLGGAFPGKLVDQFHDSCYRAGRYLVKWDEPGVLANHHAMAVLPVFEAARLLNSDELWDGYQAKLDEFYTYVDPEGWCLEYDGADPGYLSATVSFLAKIYKHRESVTRVKHDHKMLEVMKGAVDFCSYFAYPNGHYAGTLGSRQTLHFYPHGFEILAPEYPPAAAVADAMLRGLDRGALVPPAIQGDRYFQYRVPELLLSWADYGKRPDSIPKLPCEGDPFQEYFPNGRFYIRNTGKTYFLANLAKGGIIKHFDLATGKLIFNDCGVLAEMKNGQIATSQWIDKDYKVEVEDKDLYISGAAHLVPTKLFTPVKFIVFRLAMLALGWNATLAYKIKGLIRKLLMTKAKTAPLRFARSIEIREDDVQVTDVIELTGGGRVKRLILGDEIPVRYVPQSRYFQPQELDVSGYCAPQEVVDKLNQNRLLCIRRRVQPQGSGASIDTDIID
jgi:hypothetical protein